MITTKLVARRFIVLAILAVLSLIASFQIADENLALAASRSDSVALLGVDETTATRFSDYNFPTKNSVRSVNAGSQ